MRWIRTGLALALILACTSAWAEWKLVPDKSHLSFVSTKKEHVAETNTFKSIQGSVDDAGNGEFLVDLNSVDTNVGIRDQRMREFLFQTDLYPMAVYTVSVGPRQMKALSTLEAGEQRTLLLDGTLDLHGVKQRVNADVLITKTGVNWIQVATKKPVIIRAENFELVQGVNKLMELVNLPSISKSIPVSFVLTFDIDT